MKGCSGSLYGPVRHSLRANETRSRSWPGGTCTFDSRAGGGGRTEPVLQLPVRSNPRANSAEVELRTRITCMAVRWRCRAAAGSIWGDGGGFAAGFFALCLF